MFPPNLSTMRGLVSFCGAVFLLLQPVHAVRVLTIGDSLTAEYDVIPDVPGFEHLPTDYAKVTVEGWDSKSWVEILAELRSPIFNFGDLRDFSDPWLLPRFSGYEFNWAVPGVDADQYEDFATSTALTNPVYYFLRQPLDEQLQSRIRRVVIWLGANDFRANYGAIYDGGSSESLIDGLIDDLGNIIDYVQAQRADLQIVIALVPDLGATPSKKAAHPDPAKRALVTAATEAANARIVQLAAAKGIVVADTYEPSARLVRGEPLYFGGVKIINALHPDNHPRYAFTREGLHPNTALQIVNARVIVRAFKLGYGAGLANITDAQALRLLGIHRDQPFYNWLAHFGITDRSFESDLDGDGVPHLAEFALGLKPDRFDAGALPITVGGPVPGFPSVASVTWKPRETRTHYVREAIQYSADGVRWLNVPAQNVLTNLDGSFTAAIPITTLPAMLRMKVATIPPPGSGGSSRVFLLIRVNSNP